MAKDEFLAVVSHELRTPLTPILGWLDLLRAPTINDEIRAQAYDVIERNARAQAQLVNDILDVSRITSGKLRLELKPLDLTDLVRNSIESLRLSADQKSIELRLELSEVGQAPIDSSRFQQIVWNLMSNAIKFTAPGGWVSIVLRRNGSETASATAGATAGATVNSDMATLEIADNGQGFASEFAEQMFEAFRQADSSSTRKSGGLGLGLAIVRHIVEAHGGRVEAHSLGAGLGATFRVQVPLLNPAKSESARAFSGAETLNAAPIFGPATIMASDANAAVPVAGAQWLRDARVLLIDDEADTARNVGSFAGKLRRPRARGGIGGAGAANVGRLRAATGDLRHRDARGERL